MIGKTIGPYQVVAKLGEGGMGEVYRARDARLGRDVALKILPRAFSSDPDRLARFEREAQLLASLNHPNMAMLYGFEHHGDVRALVLELVEGDTLDERLRTRGAMPVDEAIAVARQIADGLDAAHQKGIVHRDLKPANIKLSPDGAVKILDFGIAKALHGTDPNLKAVELPTAMATEHGVLVGTAPYMSPEQARGQAVDKRTDVWAFGCVLYEMLSGRKAFHGDTPSDAIARILGADPDWAALPPSAPAGVVRLIKRCLEKDPKRRLRDVGDFDLALDTSSHAPAGRRASTAVVAVVSAALAAAAGVGAASLLLGGDVPPTAPPVRFEVPVQPSAIGSGAFALSPDGRQLVFAGTGHDGIMRIWRRALAEVETHPLIGSENEVKDNSTMWWSPDSRFVGFYAEGRVKKIEITGGAPQVICDVPDVAIGGAWSRDGTVVVGSTGGGLVRCSDAGGAPARVTDRESNDPAEVHLFPSFLPDGRRVLYLRVWRSNPARTGLYLADLGRPADQQSRERIAAVAFSSEFALAPDGSGRIVFVRDGALYAVRFDIERGAAVGEPELIAASVGTFRDGASFRTSSGVLAYRGGNPEYQLTWFDRSGTPLGTVGEPGDFRAVVLSPDANHAAVLRENRLNRADADIWTIDIRRNVTARFSSDPLVESMPAFSADGASLFYVSGHGSGDLWSQPFAGGAPTPVLTRSPDQPYRLNSILTSLGATRDGRFVLFSAESRASTRSDVWLTTLDGRATPLLNQPFDETHPTVSPDGRRLAYVSNQSGINEVLVAPLAADSGTLAVTGAPALVSQGGATSPLWRGDNRELFFQSGPRVMAVAISSDGIGRPVTLFQVPNMLTSWGATADGQRFLIAVPRQSTPAPFTILLNWQSALSR